MPNTLQIKRGLQASLPIGSAGELLFTTDTKRLYISDGSATNLLQGASSLLTTGAVPFSDANGKLTMNASSFYWDNTNNRLGIGTATPSAIIHSVGSVTAATAIARGNYLQPTLVASANNDTLIALDIAPTFTTGAFTGVQSIALRLPNGGRITNAGTGGGYNVYIATTETTLNSPTSTGTIGFQLNYGFVGRFMGTTGNFILQNGGTFTDAGFRLDVNGTARVSGAFRADNTLLVNGTSINASAIAQFDSGTRGFLPPRMTTTQKNAIASPAAGLVVFDTTLGKLCVFSTTWQTITSI